MEDVKNGFIDYAIWQNISNICSIGGIATENYITGILIFL
jgi:hypothetical protein